MSEMPTGYGTIRFQVAYLVVERRSCWHPRKGVFRCKTIPIPHFLVKET
jgi:hypothetical protein